MSGKAVAVIAGVAMGAVVSGPAMAQGVRDGVEPSRPAVARSGDTRSQVDQLRYQIGTMERVLENAVEHGASVWRDRLAAIAPVQALLVENARVRGYRLDEYGVFFDIDVPSLETTLVSALQTLDQNGLGVKNALSELKTYIQSQAANDPNLQQALRRLELQFPAAAAGVTTTAAVSGPRVVSGTAVASESASAPVNDPILTNPAEVFRAEVMQAVVDALVDYSAPLGLGANEWLTVGVRRNEVRPRIGLESNAQTVIARLRGGDLIAFRTGQISREELLKRVEVRVQ